jgi:hypothetical protein
MRLGSRFSGEALMPGTKRKRVRKSLIEKLPERIRESAVMRRQSIRPSSMTKYQQQMLLLFMPEISRWFFARLMDGVKRGNKTDQALWAEMAGHIQRKNGININQQILSQQNVNATAPRYSMDQIVRELQEQTEMKTIDTTLAIEPGGSDVNNVAVEA